MRTVLLVFGFHILLLASLALCKQADVTPEEEDEDIEVEEPVVEKTTEKPAPKEKPKFQPPKVDGNIYFAEYFANRHSLLNWIRSESKKDETDEQISKYDGTWSVEEPSDNVIDGDFMLIMKDRAKHYAISHALRRPFKFTGRSFVAQYEVRFQEGIECGGAYIKLLSEGNLSLKQFNDKTPYTIMFGPDKCGNDYKLHFIFRHKNPKTGSYDEKHAKKQETSIESFFTDKKTHLYTLIINSDNSWEIYVDQSLINSGSLLADVEPAVNPPKEIADPDDKKPSDWDEREKIADPDAKKPDDWDESEPKYLDDMDATKPDDWLEDEPKLIPDADAKKPEDWDEEMDGAWEAPQVDNPKCKDVSGCGPWTRPRKDNPKYKGTWHAPMIDNPHYKGKWTPRQIPNPDFFEDLEPYKMTPISAVGLELWSMTDSIAFDNFIVTDAKKTADAWAAQSWKVKSREESRSGGSGKSFWDSILDVTNERPWLWAVFIFVIILPIFLLIVYCCSGSDKDDEALAKKYDIPVPDEPAEDETADGEQADEEDNEQEEVDEEVEAEQAPVKEPSVVRRSDLNEPDEHKGSGDAPEQEDKKEDEKS